MSFLEANFISILAFILSAICFGREIYRTYLLTKEKLKLGIRYNSWINTSTKRIKEYIDIWAVNLGHPTIIDGVIITYLNINDIDMFSCRRDIDTGKIVIMPIDVASIKSRSIKDIKVMTVVGGEFNIKTKIIKDINKRLKQ